MPMAIPQQQNLFRTAPAAFGGRTFPQMIPQDPRRLALYQGLQGSGQQIQARAAPRFANGAGGGMQSMAQLPMGLLSMLGGGGGPGGFGGGMQGFIGGLLDQLPDDIRAQIPASWNTQTIPAGTPHHWLFDMFNRKR